jgi:hypothetical protein
MTEGGFEAAALRLLGAGAAEALRTLVLGRLAVLRRRAEAGGLRQVGPDVVIVMEWDGRGPLCPELCLVAGTPPYASQPAFQPRGVPE